MNYISHLYGAVCIGIWEYALGPRVWICSALEQASPYHDQMPHWKVEKKEAQEL